MGEQSKKLIEAASAMYSDTGGPTDEELARFGLTREDVEDEDDICWIYPENFEAFSFFASIRTQWRVGLNGKTGLDYTAVKAAMSMRNIRKSRRAALLDDVQIMEAAALKTMREKSGR